MQFLDNLTQLGTQTPTDIVQETILEFIKGESPAFQYYEALPEAWLSCLEVKPLQQKRSPLRLAALNFTHKLKKI